MVDTTLIDFITGYGKEGVFLVLFGYLFWDTRKESKAREGRLTEQLAKSTEQLDKSIDALEKLQKNFDTLNGKIDQMLLQRG